jgi:hypothetical protein
MISHRVDRNMCRLCKLQTHNPEIRLHTNEGLAAIWEITKDCWCLSPAYLEGGAERDAQFRLLRHVVRTHRL